MTQPVICNSDSKQPFFSDLSTLCARWAVPVTDLSEVTKPDRDHAYILPDNSVWILNYDGTGMIQLNAGGTGGQPTMIKNEDGYLVVSGSGTYDVTIDVNYDVLMSDFYTKSEADTKFNQVLYCYVNSSRQVKISLMGDKTENLIVMYPTKNSSSNPEKFDIQYNETSDRTNISFEYDAGSGNLQIAHNGKLIYYDTLVEYDSYRPDAWVTLDFSSNILRMNLTALSTQGSVGRYKLWNGTREITSPTVAFSELEDFVRVSDTWTTTDATVFLYDTQLLRNAAGGSLGNRVIIANNADAVNNSAFGVTIDDVHFSIEKYTNDYWFVYVTNKSSSNISFSYHFVHFYSASGQEGGSTSSINLAPGQKSDRLELDLAGLGYGSAILSRVNHLIAVVRNNTQTIYEMNSILNKASGTVLSSYIEKIG